MLCFRDKTFCSSDVCINSRCDRHKSHVPKNVDMPVAWSNFYDTCEDKKTDEQEVTVFVDGVKTDKKCPVTQEDNCSCGGVLVSNYGLTPYGLGGFMYCEKCRAIYNFLEDIG